jgi:hypothetical protein
VTHCILAAAVAACAKMGGRAVMDDSTFVATMAQLHALERNFNLSDAARDSLRRRVLQEQGLSPADLERQARGYADDPQRASEIWRAIALKTLRSPDDSSGANGPAEGQQQTR